MSSSPRISIRCPNCGKDGTARAELLNRRVSCKHCRSVFRASPVGPGPAVASTEDLGASPATVGEGIPGDSGRRIEVLEAEIRKLREHTERLEAARLQQALESHSVSRTLAPPKDSRGGLRDEELWFLRAQLDRARDEVEAGSRLRHEEASSFEARDLAHAEEVRALEGQVDRARAEVRSVEARLADEARANAAAIEALRAELDEALRERDEARGERDRLVEERDRLAEERDRLVEGLREARRAVGSHPAPSTVVDVAALISGEIPALSMADGSTIFDGSIDPSRAEFDRLRADDTAIRTRPGFSTMVPGLEGDDVRRDLATARAELAAAVDARDGLACRLKAIEAAMAAAASAPRPVAEVDPAWIEAERKKAADEAVKGAWADFERRLADTQARLKAATSRADLLEIEAREARRAIAGRAPAARAIDDGSSFDESAYEGSSSMNSMRALPDPGDDWPATDDGEGRPTPADAETRLAFAHQFAIDRKDRALIDRIGRVAEAVRADLEGGNHALAETSIRGVEIEAGLDPGGFSVGGLRFFRPDPEVVARLDAAWPAFDRAIRSGDPDAIGPAIEEIAAALGPQAGLPEVRRPGRTPTIRRPIAEAEAARLFADAVASGPVDPDLDAPLLRGCAEARGAIEGHAPDRLDAIDAAIEETAGRIARRQRPDGHFEPTDPLGTAEAESAECALALASAGKALDRTEWVAAALRAANWAADQPCSPDFAATAATASLLAWAFRETDRPGYLDAMIATVTVGILPGQAPNGRWVDPRSAETPNHLAILRGLLDAWEALPYDLDDVRHALKGAVDRATSTLLEECKALGVPSNGEALRELVRRRDLFWSDQDPRLEAAILDSATVVQELCRDGAGTRLGVAPDQLATLTKI